MAQRLSITLPDDLYESIKKLAEENIRSISAQIAYMIKNAPTDHSYYPYTGIRTPENPEGKPSLTSLANSHTYRRNIID